MSTYYPPTKALLAVAMLIISATLRADVQATNVLTDSFDTYAAGSLVGQGGWTTAGSTTTNPIKVVNPNSNAGYVTLKATGQNAYKAFSSSVSNSAGNSLTTTFSLTLSTAQSPGDYFAYLASTAGDVNNQYEKIWAVSTTGGYVLGIAGDGSSNVAYGNVVLGFGTSVSVSVIWNFVAGARNDTFTLNVNGSAYASQTWTSGDEPATLAAFNLKQGNSSSYVPTVSSFDNLFVDSVSPVPEPATVFGGLLLVGVFGWNQRGRLGKLALRGQRSRTRSASRGVCPARS